MFSNLKEFLIKVQDGLTSNTNLQQTLLEAQKLKLNFTAKQKILSSGINLNAGSEILDKYTNDWKEIHENSEKNAFAAESVDNVIEEIHRETKKRLMNAAELCYAISNLPKLNSSINECMEYMTDIQVLLNSVENDLMNLEDLIDRQEMAKRRMEHHYHFSMYREQKLASLQRVRGDLEKECMERSTARERQQQLDRKKKEISIEQTFDKDVADYVSGHVLPKESGQSAITLEQVDLGLANSNELETFLNS